jgi:methylase of polypeptide subunit release factors
MIETALEDLLTALKARGYRFVTITPASHARVVARPDRQAACSVEDVLGWSLPFAAEAIDREILDLLRRADALDTVADGFRSRIRVSSLGDDLFLHSAYPTDAENAVFFGPDSYRFADLIQAELDACTGTLVDIGTGSGVGAIVAAKRCPGARVFMTDINAEALRLAAVNARAAGVSATGLLGEGLSGIEGPIEVALANPPYIIDHGDRAYRDGGAMFGGQVSLDMARMAVARLAPGGRLILYTGSAIVRGKDALREALGGLGCALRYREIDPDVFGEELADPAYAEVDRIALIAAVLTK